MDTIKKVANAILDAGEGCQSGLVYVDPFEAAKAAVAVLSAEERSYNAGFNDGWEAANGEPPEAALSADAEPVDRPKFTKNADGSFTVTGGVFENNAELSSFIDAGLKNEDFEPRAAHPAPSVAVKALEWEKISDGYFCAAGNIFTYHSVELKVEGYNAGKWHRSGGDVGVGFESSEEAMKAEQDHYAALVRSALTDNIQADPEQNGYCKVIEVEKLLCKKLGREWTPTGISIVSLIDALSAQVQDVAEVSPTDYMRRHDAAIAAYEANTPSDYRYSAVALRKAVDAAFAVAAAPADKLEEKP